MQMKIPRPETTPLDQILPSEPLLLMGAGPVPIPHAVAKANSVVINHLGDTMTEVINRLKKMARYAFQTENEKFLGVAGPSSAAMEMAVTNLLWPGRSALILTNGIFSERMGLMAQAVGADVDFLHAETTSPIFPEMVEAAFAKKHYDVVTIVQGETSCGVFNKYLPDISKICKKNGALTIVDAVCTLTTMPLYMDEWGLDIVLTGGQKGISSIPGVSLISFSSDAWDVIEKRDCIGPHWCLDASKADEFWGQHKYHYTAPVPGILAMHEALRLICEETLERRFLRHKICSEALQVGLETMGLELFVKTPYRLNSVVAIKMPEEIDGTSIRKTMAEKFNVEIAGAFGHNIIRIGQMGEQCRSHNLFKTLYALGISFRKEGLAVNISTALAKMEEQLSKNPDFFIA